MSEEHDWVRRRLPSWRLGLLNDAERARIELHVSGCGSCRQAAELFEEAPGDFDPAQHIPAELIAGWERARRELTGLEREIVRWHLDSCPDCREDLSRLGFSPEMDPGVDPEPVVKSAADAATLTRLETESNKRRRWERRQRWLLGTWATATTVAAIVLAMSRGAKPTITPAAEDDHLSIESAPTLVLSTSRGGGQTVDVGASTRFIVLGVPSIREFPAQASIEVELRSPTGESLLRREFQAGELTARTGIVLNRTARGWIPGAYMLILRGEGHPVIEYPFEIRAPQTRP